MKIVFCTNLLSLFQESFGNLKHYRPFRFVNRQFCVPKLTRSVLLIVCVTVGAKSLPPNWVIGGARAQTEAGSLAAMSNEELFRRGQEAIAKKDFFLAGKYIKAIAERGDAKAQFVTGTGYETGALFAKDEKQASIWYLKAADQGYAQAQAKMGAAYFEGRRGMAVDYAKAFEFLNKAVAQNDPDAQAELGRMYETGTGAPLSYAKALELYRKAAEQKNLYAQFRIGMMYNFGTGVQQDYSTAAEWLHKASEAGYILAKSMLGSLYLDGLGVPKDPAEAAHLFQSAADAGEDQAQRYLGLMYVAGMGVPQDIAKGKAWLQKAAAQGNQEAKDTLSKLDSHKAQTSADTAGKVPPALEFRCILEARVPSAAAHKSLPETETAYVECLRSNWQRLFGSAPFPADR